MPKERAGKKNPKVSVAKVEKPVAPKPTIPETLPPMSKVNTPTKWRNLGASKEGVVLLADTGDKKIFKTIEEAEEWLAS